MTQAELQAALAACRTETERIAVVMRLSTTQKAILIFGDHYRPGHA